MRKRIINQPDLEQPNKSATHHWLNLQDLLELEISSEDESHPIEFALLPEHTLGWRAANSGEQIIRLIFIEPQDIQCIHIEFNEPQTARTQEYVLRYSANGEVFQEIVRQQWNFNPVDASLEIESHEVALSKVKTLELIITPDIAGGDARATLQTLRIA